MNKIVFKKLTHTYTVKNPKNEEMPYESISYLAGHEKAVEALAEEFTDSKIEDYTFQEVYQDFIVAVTSMWGTTAFKAKPEDIVSMQQCIDTAYGFVSGMSKLMASVAIATEFSFPKPDGIFHTSRIMSQKHAPIST